MVIQKISQGFSFKEISDTGEFEGIASVFNIKDSGNDIVLPGAFSESLKVYPPSKVKMLWQHETKTPIGVWHEIQERKDVLYVKGSLALEIQSGKEAYIMMKKGMVDGLSIGYRAVEKDYDAKSGARVLKSVLLREISVVTFPMNEGAQVLSIRSSDEDKYTLREFEAFLREEGGFSHSEARAISEKGYKSWLEGRDDFLPSLSSSLEQLLQNLRK